MEHGGERDNREQEEHDGIQSDGKREEKQKKEKLLQLYSGCGHSLHN
jgi:hypothetical protein